MEKENKTSNDNNQIDKLDLSTPDLVQQNIDKVAKLFPNCLTEGPKGKAIDFDLLKQELNHQVVEGNKERYRLEWPGKREAIVTANLPTNKTLRPVREDSVDFDTTENLYIEGDNLEVLKLLQESYLGKIKMIYIDPPYNTGNDFVYVDDFKKTSKESNLESGLIDKEGRKLSNLKDNPANAARYHSDWLTMIYPRIKLARNLLSNKGYIFISIGDDEVHNLRKMMDEIFGEGNFIANIGHKARASISNDKIISSNHNHILLYCKDFSIAFKNRARFGIEPDLSGFTKKDDKGEYKLTPVDGPGGAKKGNPCYEFKGVKGYWRYSKETMQKLFEQGEIVVTAKNLQRKSYKCNALNKRKKISTWWDNGYLTATATRELDKLMDGKFFDNPKNVELLKLMLTLCCDESDLVLDFFSGSGTLAQAVMEYGVNELNYILVQLPEAIDEKSEAYKVGYKNICEIGKERIRRAAVKIVNDQWSIVNERKAELEKEKAKTKPDQQKIDDLQLTIDNLSSQIEKLDTGFRVYRLDTSNMQDVYHRPQDYDQGNVDLFADHIKPDRTADDLLAQVMLDWGLPLSLPIESTTIEGKQLFKVAGNALYACFDSGVDENLAKAIAKEAPLRVVFKDNGFKGDTSKTNVKQLLKQLSPETEMKVI